MIVSLIPPSNTVYQLDEHNHLNEESPSYSDLLPLLTKIFLYFHVDPEYFFHS